MGRLTALLAALTIDAGCSRPATRPDAVPGPTDAMVPPVAIEPAAFDFGSFELGSTTPLTSQTFIVRNQSQAPFDVTRIDVTGAEAPDFAITLDNCPPTLEPAATCTVRVQFAPMGRDGRHAFLNVTGAVIVSASLSGTGLVRSNIVSFTPGARDFGDLPAGTPSAPFTFVVNNELAPATFTASIIGNDASSFTIQSSDCAAVSLHGTCSISVIMTPPYGAAFSAELQISDGGSGTWKAGLHGRSSLPLAITPDTGTFGSVLLGQPEQGGRVTYTLTNNGSASTGMLATSFTGAAASDFTVRSTTCTTLAPAQSCDVTVELTPATRGAKLAQLVVSDVSASAHAATRGDAYSLLITGPTSFPNTASNQTSAQQTFTVINASNHDTGAVTPSISGPFAIAASTCTGPVVAHSSCAIQVTFHPTSTGPKTGSLGASASPGGSDSFTLSGTGI